MEKRHPGIVTFGIVGILIGTIGLLVNGLLVIDTLLRQSVELVGVIVMLSLTANVVASVMMVTSGLGVFSLQTWARTGFVFAAAITIINHIIMFPMHFMQAAEMSNQATANQISGIVGDIGVIIFNVLIICFFQSVSIKSLFSKQLVT